VKPEKQQLIHELLDDNNRRETTLLAGSRVLRRRRHWRSARRGFALMAIAIATVLLLERKPSRQPQLQVSAPPAAIRRPDQPRALTDDELLALFPNTPVGLATLPDGKKRLIFPRPGDEQKFVTRL
jgi:hypothetical protein